MYTINVYEAKTNLSKLLEMLEEGREEEIIIARYGKKIAKLVLFDGNKKGKRLGVAKGVLKEMPFSLEDIDGEIAKSFGY